MYTKLAKMNLNTTLFIISLFFSANALKAQDSPSDDSKINYSDEQFYDFENGLETGNFQYKPSKRLEEMEKNLSGGQEKFIKNGNVEETLTNTFLNSMNTDVAINGFAGLQKELQRMFNGPDAYRVIGTFGGDLKKVITSNEGANMINIIASTVHVLLSKTGENTTEESSLGKLWSSLFSLFSSPKMPMIVDKTGELAITIVNKPNATLFVKQYWNEWQKLLGQKNLVENLNKSFDTLSALMKSLYTIKEQKHGNKNI